MKRKGWLIPILVFIFSLGFLFSYQKNQTVVSRAFAEPASLVPILWTESASDIVKMTYSSAEKEITAFREGNAWKLSTNEVADSLYIYNIITAFKEPIFNQVIEVAPSALEDYGITEFSPTLTIVDTLDNAYTLVQGNAVDNLNSYVYAPLSDSIYSMATANFSSLSTSYEDWISKELLSFDINSVDKIQVEYLGKTFSILSNEEATNRTFTSPLLAPQVINDFINYLQTSKVQKFITSEPTDHILSVYGFTTPILKCSVYLESGEILTLTVGDVNEESGLCYATTHDSPTILAIPYFDFSKLSGSIVKEILPTK